MRVIRIKECRDCPFISFIHMGQTLTCGKKHTDNIIGLSRDEPEMPDWCPLESWVDAVLREAGYDPDEVGTRLRIAAEEALAEYEFSTGKADLSTGSENSLEIGADLA